MNLTPRQTAQIELTLRSIQAEINIYSIIPLTTDSYEVNQAIAQARGKLRDIDHKLFQCHKLLDQFHRENSGFIRPAPAPRQRAFTVDDL